MEGTIMKVRRANDPVVVYLLRGAPLQAVDLVDEQAIHHDQPVLWLLLDTLERSYERIKTQALNLGSMIGSLFQGCGS